MRVPAPDGHLLRRGFAVLRHEIAMHPRPFAVAVAGATVYAAATVASSWVLGRVVDGVITPRFRSGRLDAGALLAGAVAIVAVGVLKAAGIVVRRAGATVSRYDVEATLRRRVVEHYHRLPLTWHRDRPPGELLATAGADVQAAAEILAPLPFATAVLTLLAVAAAWMLATDPFLAAVGLLLLPALAVPNLRYQRRLERPAREEQEHIGRVSAVAHESFDGAIVVKAYGAEDSEAQRFATAARALRDVKVDVATLRARYEALLDAIPAAATIATLVVGAWRVRTGHLSAGDLVAFVNLLTLLVWPLRLISYVLGSIPQTVAGFERIERVLRTPVPAVPRAVLPAAAGGDLHVEQLWFSYEPGAPVVADVNLRVHEGGTVAVVGPTGGGKSTLLLLLARLLPPDRGTIRLGGVDLGELRAEETATMVTLAFQEPFLFGATVAENILLGLDVAPDVLEHAARVARIDEFVRSLPAGYDTVVGERGATLSGGQRQRVALARALVRRPRLLLLDDATAAVDPVTEAEILRGLAGELRTTTTLLVATRPSTIALADEVVFLADGRVVAQGTHRELLAAVPAYARLVHAYEIAGSSP